MSRRALSVIAALAAGCWFGSTPALATSRVALVIGNAAYQAVSALPNPANDAKAMTQALNAAGFEVVVASDLTQSDMREALRIFSGKVAEKGSDTVALVFYAGHGVQVEGENFLVPVDARIDREADVALETLRLADLMKTLESVPSKMRIVILDACRNNPFTAVKKATGRGLAIVDAPTGSIVAYSTAPGAEAADGTGRNSPYTAALIQAIKEPGIQIEQLFKSVRLRVHKETDGRQTPWESSSLTGDFTFFGEAATAVAAAPEAQPASDTPVVVASLEPQQVSFSSARRSRVNEIAARPVSEAYEIAIEENSVEAYEEFVRVYPSDPLCDRVRKLLRRRIEMVSWRNAVAENTAEAYQSYISRHPFSDHAAAATRLQERPRIRTIDPVVLARVILPTTRGVSPRPLPPFGEGNRPGGIFNPQRNGGINPQGGILNPRRPGGIFNPQREANLPGRPNVRQGGILNPPRNGGINPQGGILNPQSGINPQRPGGVLNPQGKIQNPSTGGINVPQQGGVLNPRRPGGVTLPQQGGVQVPQRPGSVTLPTRPGGLQRIPRPDSRIVTTVPRSQIGRLPIQSGAINRPIVQRPQFNASPLGRAQNGGSTGGRASFAGSGGAARFAGPSAARSSFGGGAPRRSFF